MNYSARLERRAREVAIEDIDAKLDLLRQKVPDTYSYEESDSEVWGVTVLADRGNELAERHEAVCWAAAKKFAATADALAALRLHEFWLYPPGGHARSRQEHP